MDDHLKWRETETRLIKNCHIFDLYQSQRVSGNGRKGSFYLLKSNAWVNIVPVLKDPAGKESFIMVKQYRHGVDRVTTEFPAGLVDGDEGPEEAAGRELLEETGFRAGSLKCIGKICPNPAFMTNWCYTYLAEGLEKKDDQKLDELELLDVLQVPAEEVISNMGDGTYINAMALIALQWYLRYRSL